ncbi:hypothetical protein G9A89_016820 [Geosiphon pyriformis]|nr:hypothetical protein G9A89_016820 [Geosiphon pyriformis]
MMEYVFVDDLHRYKRLKVTRACESCRRRKVKCDGGSGGSQTPCSSCRKLKIDCIFSNMALKRAVSAAPKTEAEQMDERWQRVESLLQKLDEDEIKQGKKGTQGERQDTRVVKKCNGRRNHNYSDESVSLLKENEGSAHVGEIIICPEPQLPFVHLPSHAGNPTPDLAADLIQLYFQNVHPYVPILHKADFLRCLTDKKNPVSPLLMYAIFAMAAKFSDDPMVRLDVMKPETAGLLYYNWAKDLLDDFLDTPRLSTIQAQILMLKFQEGIPRKGFFFRSWLYFGVIIRMAENLGLNTKGSQQNMNISREEMTSRKRLWQTCFLYDQLMNGAQGRDAVISLSNADIELPSKADFPDEQEFQIQTDFVHLVQLTKILASVGSLNSTASGTWSSNPKLQILDATLDAWTSALPLRLQCSSALEERNNSLPQFPTSHFAGFLNILYHTIQILLHRPYITSIQDSDKISTPHPHHLNKCTIAANSISQTSQSMFNNWGPMVFQYPIRGGNFGVFCLVAASMIHLVNMGSSDLRFARTATEHLVRTLKVLGICVEQGAASELRDKVHSLEAAFSAQQARNSAAVLMMFHPGSNSNPLNSSGASHHSSLLKSRRTSPKRRATAANGVQITIDQEGSRHLLSSSLPDSFFDSTLPIPSQFQDGSLYLLADDINCEHQSFDNSTLENVPASVQDLENRQSFSMMHHHQSMDDGSNVQLDINKKTFFDNLKQIDLNTSDDPNTTYCDPNTLSVWSNTTQQHAVWSSAGSSGTISPASMTTSPITTPAPSTRNHSPIPSTQSLSLEHLNFLNSTSNVGSNSIIASSTDSTPSRVCQQLTSLISPVILASQKACELSLYSEY